ncbi:MAG: hypothetical protein GY832_42705 [Chloroflexi bacterium]|nr:hypothetical protein [Chloroflexota bacterium]
MITKWDEEGNKTQVENEELEKALRKYWGPNMNITDVAIDEFNNVTATIEMVGPYILCGSVDDDGSNFKGE